MSLVDELTLGKTLTEIIKLLHTELKKWAPH
jgi:hypothetical protein